MAEDNSSRFGSNENGDGGLPNSKPGKDVDRPPLPRKPKNRANARKTKSTPMEVPSSKQMQSQLIEMQASINVITYALLNAGVPLPGLPQPQL